MHGDIETTGPILSIAYPCFGQTGMERCRTPSIDVAYIRSPLMRMTLGMELLMDTTLNLKQTDPQHVLVTRADEELAHAARAECAL